MIISADLQEGELSFEAEAASKPEALALLHSKIPAGWIRIWDAKAVRRGDRWIAARIAAPPEVATRSRSSRARVAAVQAMTAAGSATLERLVSMLDADQPGEVAEAVILALSDLGDAGAIAPLRAFLSRGRWQSALAARVLTNLVRDHAAEVTPDELHALGELHAPDQASIAASDRVVTTPVDCSELNELARAELARRGR